MAGKTDRVLEIEDIIKVLPHGFPFLFVDRVLELDPDKRILCLKNVTVNEPFFQGHFRDKPVMPGVLLVETMAQAGGVLVLHSYGKEYSGRDVYFLGMDKVRFRRVVRPGDQLQVEAKVLKRRGTVWKFGCRCMVEGETVAEAELMAMVEGEKGRGRG